MKQTKKSIEEVKTIKKLDKTIFKDDNDKRLSETKVSE
jgi:hypothetical protein